MYHLALCEIYNTQIHGGYNIPNECDGHYLVIYTHIKKNYVEWNDDYEDDWSGDEGDTPLEGEYYEFTPFESEYWEFNSIMKVYRQKYREITPRHSFIRNYKKIIKHKNYIQPEIIQRIHLQNECVVAIKKTFWIRIIQRAWKRVYAERCRIFKMRRNPGEIFKREMSGRWSQRLPDLYGILRT